MGLSAARLSLPPPDFILPSSPAAYEYLFTLWSRLRTRRATTVSDYQRVWLGFAQQVCFKPLNSVVRRDVMVFRDALRAAGQSAVTVNHKIGMLKTLFRVAVEYDLRPDNPAAQVGALPSPGGKPRHAFTLADLNRIFASRIYSDATYRPRSGGGEAVFWLPLLALFTGARVEELAQLLVQDIQHAPPHGHYLDISDEAAHSKLKNAASRRRIPLHPLLVDCGFLAYVASQPGSGLLFPELKPNPRQKLGGYFSNFFSGYLRREVGITDRRKVFHSFRHTFKDMCRRAGIAEEVHDALTGHTTASIGRRYGNELFPLPPLFAAIGQIGMAGLSLRHLKVISAFAPEQLECSKTISAYYGIVIQLLRQPEQEAPIPCLLARYLEQQAVIRIADGMLLHGSLPLSKQILVQAWMEIHREAVHANWREHQYHSDCFVIDPLR